MQVTEPKSLTAYAEREWFVTPPVEWERRLRDISPVSGTVAHLRFRWREPRHHWFNPNRGMWELYSCTPKAMVQPDRAEQFRLHWSELPKAEQVGRKAYVSNYQHWMWHTHGVEARRFWVLQGPWGGTAAQYTAREKRYLDASNALSEALPLGFFDPCPFDERAVAAIVRRDRLVQAGHNIERLMKMDRPAALKAEDEEAEKVYRNQFIKWMWETTQPQAEFMKSYLGTTDADQTMRRATAAENDARAVWKDNFVETGTVQGARLSGMKKIQIAVG